MIPKLDQFSGRWALDRVIDDTLTGQTITLEGQADFAEDGTGLTYRETGQMRMPGLAPMTAQRVYLWRQSEAGISVLFEDGRPFHTLGGAGQDSHWCDPDTYRVTYWFEDWPRGWKTKWAVSGPRKQYEMTSVFSRMANG